MGSQRNVLLLNASNISSNLTYPYAFVQVSEIANRFNVRVIRRDMFGLPKDQWIPYLQNELSKINFDMVLLTLRNTDTLGSGDYHIRADDRNYQQPIIIKPPEQPNYYPIETAKILIENLRQITDIPIVTGGYGFSVMPDKIVKHIKPDYGVIGGPDAFFEYFEDILVYQNLDQVANLVYRRNEAFSKGPLRYFPPASRREYTEEIIADRQAFYARNYPGQEVNKVRSVPIEAVRGCSKSCTFCSEPLVKGPELQYRDIEVIVDEINFLSAHGHNLVFLISSEINAEGPDFLLKLADRILAINEERSAYERVYWYTFYLPALSLEELKHLRKARFLGGANDIVSLDDKNLAAIKAPYKSRDVIKHLMGAKKVVEEERQQVNKKRPSLEERVYGISPPLEVPYSETFMTSWWFFLGNSAATPETIRVTLKEIDEAGLSEYFDTGAATKATRLFEYVPQDAELLSCTRAFIQNGPTESYNELHPSYAYAPALVRHFGNKKAVADFFDYIGPFLSNEHLFKKDWSWFLAKYADPDTFLLWWQTAIRSPPDLKALSPIPEVQEFLNFLRENPSGENISLLFNPTPGRKKILNLAAHRAIRYIFISQDEELFPVMNLLGISPRLEDVFNLSPYKVAVKLFEAYADKKDLLDAINEGINNPVVARFFAEYLIYLNGIPFKAENRIFFEQ
ncbi:MAG: hypothetical protein ACE5OZ_19960 [Candidatus Heimdallarchaeota archaeon]